MIRKQKLRLLRLLRRIKYGNFTHHRALELSACVVGGLAGLTGALFQLGVEHIILEKNSWINKLASGGLDGWFWGGLLSSVMLLISLWLVRRFSPESGGSGIQEIEGYLAGVRSAHWSRALPVKFIGGLLALGSGMILGREGPSVQMGGNCGAFINRVTPSGDEDSGHALVAAGAAAGLAAAFNAPLAGVIFVVEEMREPFRYNYFNIRLLTIAVLMSTLVVNLVIGEQPALPITVYNTPGWSEMLLYLVMGGIMGIAGAALNHSILTGLDWMDRLKAKPVTLYLWIAILGFSIGILHFLFPEQVGGGYELINWALEEHVAMQGLFFIILVRFILTIVCFCSGVPGGVFAPMIVLGTLIGLWCGNIATFLVPEIIHSPYPFAVAGMGALFAATVQAPVTGIILVVEMTANYTLIIPIMIACIGADIVAHHLKTRPLYTILLERLLRSQKSNK